MNNNLEPNGEASPATFNNAPELDDNDSQSNLSPREKMDPHGTLPTVEFETRREVRSETLAKTEIDIVHNGQRIGTCTLQEHQGSMHFDGINIDLSKTGGEDMRGQGYGMAIYLKAIELAHERGLPFETQNWNQTEDAVRVWLKLHEAGVAKEIIPFAPDRDSPHPNRYKGKYRVPLQGSKREP